MCRVGNGLYEVRMAAGTEKVEILVRDVQGRLLQKNISVAGNTTVNLTNQPAGVYWMQIRSADKHFSIQSSSCLVENANYLNLNYL